MSSYSFGTDRTDLGSEPGWALHYGDTGALFPNLGFLKRGSVATSEHFYREGSLVSASQRTGFTFGVLTGSTIPRLVALGSGSAGAFTGYTLWPQTSTTLRAARHISGAVTTIIATITVAATNAPFQFEVLVQGGQNVVNVYDAGGTNIGTFTDTNASRPVSGYNGILSLTNVASTANNGDDFSGNIVAGGGGGGVSAGSFFVMFR